MSETAEQAKPTTHSGFVALIGAPNAGKSTLVNQLVGTKVSIVTHKVQTTRAIVRGIATHRDAQIVLLDTPGIFKPRRALDRAMVTTAWGGAKDADIVLVLIDAERGIKGDADMILDSLRRRAPAEDPGAEQDRPVRPESLLELTTDGQCARRLRAHLHGLGADRLRLPRPARLSGRRRLPEGPWYYPEDQISDLPMRQLAAEITREKLYLRLHQELPYSSHVETEKWEEKKDGSVRIEQVIYVERDSQKKIVLGHKGETIRAIGQAARMEIAEILEQKVHLFLFVKVRENWGDDPERYREMGLEFPG